MYKDKFGEFVCGYWGLKGAIAPFFFLLYIASFLFQVQNEM